MLAQDEKTRIRLEEEYRHEIRKQLEELPGKSKKTNAWGFLNSAFVLWFLSAVLLSLASYLYTKWEKSIEQKAIAERENTSAQRKLDVEIANRLAYTHFETYESQNNLDENFEMRTRLVSIIEKPSETQSSVNVLPEYANRNLRSLLWELLQVLPENTSPEEKEKIEKAYNQSKLFQAMYSTKKYNLATAKELRDILKDYFNLERWGRPFKEINVVVD